MTSEWNPTACILCECNCGLEVQLGGDDGRRFVRLRGDRAHPGSKGYVCQKAGRLDHYQNSRDRLLSPLRRRADGSFEEIDWDTAIAEVAERLARVRDTHGGESVFYYGGGGQGNHLPAGYASATRNVLGSIFRSNAIAQEKTGEYWVNEQMFGPSTFCRGDFEHCEVGIFLGKNPWQSHGIPRARVTLKEMAKDPDRTLIVVDPRRTETADMADIHLRVRPGTDAWLVTAWLGVLVQEELADLDWLGAHTTGAEQVLPLLAAVPVADYCERCGVPEEQVRQVARRLAAAQSVAVFEDLGTTLADRLPLFIAAVIGLSFLLLMMVFRSIVIPIKAALMNLLSIGAAYGVMVAIFQWGWAKDLIGLDATGPIQSFIPMLLFAVLFGLSMDYEVFLLSRIREEYVRSGDNATAVADGLAATAAAVAVDDRVFTGVRTDGDGLVGGAVGLVVEVAGVGAAPEPHRGAGGQGAVGQRGLKARRVLQRARAGGAGGDDDVTSADLGRRQHRAA